MPQTRKSDRTTESEPEEVDEKQVKPLKFKVKVADRWIFMMNNSILQQDGNNENKHTICSLKHPKSGQKTLYLFANNDTEVYEIKQFKEDYRSWFIGDHVQNDGSLYITTPIDPVFLVLPYLRESEKTGKYMTLDQTVIDEEYSECHRLLNTSLTDLHLVTDCKGDEDFKAYKYNPEKTLSWLKLKTEQVVCALRRSNTVLSGSRAADLIKGTKEAGDHDEYLKYAFGIVSDYIPLELSTSLQEYLWALFGEHNPSLTALVFEEHQKAVSLGNSIPTVTEKRPTDSPNPPAKRAKLGDITPLEDYSKNVASEAKPVGKQTTAQKKLDKVDKKGMKSMMSFFSPKTK